MFAPVAAFFAKPAAKYGAIALGVLLLIAATVFVIDRIYSKGEEAGAGKVTGAVQTETIKKLDEARKEKAKTDEKVRSAPIDSVIDGLR